MNSEEQLPLRDAVEREKWTEPPAMVLAAESSKTMKAFASYSHHDTKRVERLKAHLSVLRYAGGITILYDREIRPGAPLNRAIRAQLDECELFLPIVTPDLLASRYCFRQEMKQAMAYQRAGRMLIVPVIFEPCDWQRSPLGRFKALPEDGLPVSCWRNENEALLNVVTALRGLIRSRRLRPR